MDFFCREVSNFCRGEQILKRILLVPRKCSSKSLWQPMCHITRISIPPCQGGESLSALYAVRPAKVNWRKPPQHFAASENKSTLLQEVEKRHEHRVHITKKRCAELDVAARLRLNYCNYHFRPAKSVSRWTKRCRDACRPANPPFHRTKRHCESYHPAQAAFHRTKPQVAAHKKGWPGNSAVSLFEMCDSVLLYDRTGSYKSLTSLVVLIFLEVLNETSCEVLSLLLPN